jgi:Ras-related protein Rab-2A
VTFKIIIVGSSCVGKSCLLMRYVNDQYTPQHYPTIGMEFFSKRLVIDGVSIKLQIWDTAGQETFQSIVRNFYKNSDAVFVVYSIADRKTFEAVGAWVQEARDNAPESAFFVLIGAQKDLMAHRQVEPGEGEQAMRDFRFQLFFETSAKEDENIGLAFEETTKQLLIGRMMNKKAD